MELFSSCHIMSLLCCCVLDKGCPLFIHGARWCWELFLVWGPSCTASAWRHAIARARGGREASTGGRASLGVGHPLPCPLATAFVWWAVGWTWITPWWCLTQLESSCWVSPLFLCANQHQKAPFNVLLHAFVFMSCKIIFSKYMWN
jgi:hypothetical protein